MKKLLREWILDIKIVLLGCIVLLTISAVYFNMGALLVPREILLITFFVVFLCEDVTAIFKRKKKNKQKMNYGGEFL